MEQSLYKSTAEATAVSGPQHPQWRTLPRGDASGGLSLGESSGVSFNMSEYESQQGSFTFRKSRRTLSILPSTSSSDSDAEKKSRCRRSHWLYRLCMSWFIYTRKHWLALLTSAILCVVLSAVTMGMCVAYFSQLESRVEENAIVLATETGRNFGKQLDRATIPLLSLAQFVHEIESFRKLTHEIGPPDEPGSLPYISTMHRNVTSSLCNDPQIMARFERIAETVKTNVRMSDVMMLLELAPYGVVCMLDRRIDQRDYFRWTHPLNSTDLMGLDYLSHPLRSEAEKTLNSNGQMTLTGPRKMTIPCRKDEDESRGGRCRYNGYAASVFEARLPVQVPGYSMMVSTSGGSTKVVYPYWGFAIASIHLEALIDESGVFDSFEKNGFDFQLVRQVKSEGKNGSDNAPSTVVIAESMAFSMDKRVAMTSDISLDPFLAGESWTMTVAYDAAAPWQVWVVPLLFCLSFCISFLVYKILLQKQEHVRMKGETMAERSKVETERNMTAYFAHELRNPLSAMDSALKAMPDEYLKGPGQELISGMQICSTFMSSIMNNLLDVRKMEEGELTLKCMPVNLNHHVENLHRMFMPNVRPGVEFLWRSNFTSKDGKWVIGDAHRLQQIFTNIITNALKYTTTGSVTLTVGWEDGQLCRSEGSGETYAGSEETTHNITEKTAHHTTDDPTIDAAQTSDPDNTIYSSIDSSGKVTRSASCDDMEQGNASVSETATAERKGIMKVSKTSPYIRNLRSEDPTPSRIRFECVDTGPGILKSNQKELFKKFVQRGGAPGTGLGLAISKHLVDLMGGEIFYESDPTIKPGSTCVVLLPLPPCHVPPKSRKSNEAKDANKQQKVAEEKDQPIEDEISFLIVDDIKMNRMMLKRRFQKGVAPNCSITEVPTGEKALEILETGSFDVIIVDQYMEDAGGMLLGTDTILAMRRQKIKSLIIGCSGNDIEKDFLEAGADYCWQKPLPSNATIIRQLRIHLLRTQGMEEGGSITAK